jgi:hypothetical protein
MLRERREMKGAYRRPIPHSLVPNLHGGRLRHRRPTSYGREALDVAREDTRESREASAAVAYSRVPHFAKGHGGSAQTSVQVSYKAAWRHVVDMLHQARVNEEAAPYASRPDTRRKPRRAWHVVRMSSRTQRRGRATGARSVAILALLGMSLVATTTAYAARGSARLTPRAARSWSGLATTPSAKLEAVGPIDELRADGRLVAADTEATSSACEGVVVWNPLTGHAIGPIVATNCPSDPSFDDLFSSDWIALGGQRLTVIDSHLDDPLNGSYEFVSAPVGRFGRIPALGDDKGISVSPSDPLPYVDASGNITVLTRRGQQIECDQANPKKPIFCGPQAGQGYRTTVWLRSGYRWRWIWGANAWAQVVSVDRRRVAVQRDGQLLVLAPSGTLLDSLSIPRGLGVQVRLAGAHVVALVGRTLLVYSTTTGMETAAWHLEASRHPALQDARGDVAVYTDGARVHLIEFVDGRDSAIVAPNASSSPLYAQLEAIGLVYSYTRPDQRGELTFVTSPALRRLLREPAAAARS